MAECVWRSPPLPAHQAPDMGGIVCSTPHDVAYIAYPDYESDIPLALTRVRQADVPELYTVRAMNATYTRVLYQQSSPWRLVIRDMVTGNLCPDPPLALLVDACFDIADNLLVVCTSDDGFYVAYPDGSLYLCNRILWDNPTYFEGPSEGLPFWTPHMALRFFTPFGDRFAVGGGKLGRIDIYTNLGKRLTSYSRLDSPLGLIDHDRIHGGRFDRHGNLWVFGSDVFALNPVGEVIYAEPMTAFRVGEFFPRADGFVGVDANGVLWFRNEANFAAFEVQLG